MTDSHVRSERCPLCQLTFEVTPWTTPEMLAIECRQLWGGTRGHGVTPVPEPKQREWTVGFLIDHELTRVILIRKNRPEWQAGKLNGVGGKVEDGELPIHAMWREFHEETSVKIVDWELFASLTWEEGIVHFYRAFHPIEVLHKCMTMTDEKVELHGLRYFDGANPVPNLKWLIPLAAHRQDTYDVIDVVETGTTIRKPGRLEVY